MTNHQDGGGASPLPLLTYICQADPVDHLDSHPPMFTLILRAVSTERAVNEATRLLTRVSPGLQVRSCVPKKGGE
jgi:hypothetical protein